MQSPQKGFRRVRVAPNDERKCTILFGMAKNLDLGSSIYIVLYLILLPEINGNRAHVWSLQPPWLCVCKVWLWQLLYNIFFVPKKMMFIHPDHNFGRTSSRLIPFLCRPPHSFSGNTPSNPRIRAIWPREIQSLRLYMCSEHSFHLIQSLKNLFSSSVDV